ncbi:MAG: hypothetical protein KGS61_01655 [Verrucomicrobia bacterium]|nr:hypothetical protein [Verrucomicrobiota bacterium]
MKCIELPRQVHRVRRAVIFTCLMAGAVEGFSQGELGQLAMENYIVPPGSPAGAVYDVDGKTPLAGSGFLAELYAAAPGNSLEPMLSSITPFSTAIPGYFFGGIVSVPGTAPAGIAVVQVVAWRASDGATFAEANHSGAHVGASSVFQVGPLAGDHLGSAPPALYDLESFSLYVVPEPAVLTLDLLAAFGIAFNCWLNRRV